jgi:hypothetical protein
MPFLAAIPAVIAAGASAAGTAGLISGTTAAIVTGASALAGTALTAAGSIQQGNQQKAAYDYNAKVLNMQAVDAQRRGSEAEGIQRTRYQQLQGSQRAQMGASGAVVDEGSSGDVVTETAVFGERDAQMIRLDAERQAWGANTQADLSRMRGRQAETGGWNTAGQSILSGSTNFFTKDPYWKQWVKDLSPSYAPGTFMYPSGPYANLR